MSKDAILGAIRRGLKRGPLPADQRAMLEGRLATHPRHLIPARSRLPRPDQVALFIRNVEKEFGTVERVPDLAAIPAAVADFLAAQNLPARLVVAPHPELEAIDWSARPMIERESRRARDGDVVSLQHGWAGVAETGTILFPSDPTRPATLNLLPETEIVVLRASAVVGAYEEAWDRLRAERQDPTTGGFMPRNLMFVTGPSRSADIEQTLELGAHGPRRLHVLLVEDEAAPRMATTAEARAEAPVQPGQPAAPGD
ncbi:lactate utilization protein C [Roseomonas stagni]|uniref:Lactate utilization protein C n=1 Tax=Falsiroseomonas algicola TaxID=2716930 RepID=A0A6M1LS32_9PROT|nr:LUD domain-containing protein [Falsiroseomonas algicola]NGM23231.1 lactate utilization protein C [Falsiroseomonas algicola]